MRLPDRLFTVSLLGRGLLIWGGTRLLLALGGGMAGPYPASLGARGTLLLVGLVGFLGLLEARRRNEHRLLANFGVPPALVGALCAAPAGLAELLVGLAARS